MVIKTSVTILVAKTTLNMAFIVNSIYPDAELCNIRT